MEVEALCLTEHDRLEAFYKALTTGSAKVSAFFLRSLPRAAINASRHPLTFSYPANICTKHLCLGDNWAETCCPIIDREWKIITDAYTIVNFAAADSYIFASLILAAGLFSFFRALLDCLFMKIGSALRQTMKTGVRTEELQRLLELEVAIEVPVSLIMTTYGLPDVAHRPATALITLLSIFFSLTRQAKWLYEEFDVCREMGTYLTEKTPKHHWNALDPEFFPKP